MAIDPDKGPDRWGRVLLLLASLGLVSGAAGGLNVLAAWSERTPVTLPKLLLCVGGGAATLAMFFPGLWLLTRGFVGRLDFSPGARATLLRHDACTYLLGLVTFAGAFGVQCTLPLITLIVLTFIMLKGMALWRALPREQRRAFTTSRPYLAFLFLISGFAALIYQIVWERALFTAFGVNIESITVVVSLFMFGLGVGSMLGGTLAARFPNAAPLLFLVAEVGIGLFGVASLPLIRWVSAWALYWPLPGIAIAIYGLLCIPTMLMGATLPILVGHLYRHYANVGKSVGILYCINTVGSALACFLTADLLFLVLGQQGSVFVAAACNMIVGLLVSRYARRLAASEAVPDAAAPIETGRPS